ncbi:hypothetical protein ACXIUT_19885 [Achromobacter denitrificans]|jgi:hypothetical protein
MKSIRLDIDLLIKQAQRELIEAAPIPVTHHDAENLATSTHPEAILGRTFNVYALWSRTSRESPWTLMYLGERHSSAALSRLRDHLFKVGSGTKSKLEEVREIVRAGAQMGVTVILVQPESLRLAVEEELLLLNSRYLGQLPWNKKGVIAPKRRVPYPAG